MSGNFNDLHTKVKLFHKEKDPKKKAKFGVILCDEYQDIGEYDLSRTIGYEVLDIAKKTNSNVLGYQICISIAYSFIYQENEKVGREHIIKALTYAKASKNPNYIENAYSDLAILENRLGNPSEAIKNFLQAITICEKHKFTDHLLSLYKNIFMVYMSIGELGKADEYMSKKLKLENKDITKYQLSVELLIQRGFYYTTYNEHSLAKDAFEQAYKLAKVRSDYFVMCRALNLVGMRERAMQLHFEATQNYIKAIKIAEKHNFTSLQKSLYNNIYHIYETLGLNDESLHYLKKSVKLIDPDQNIIDNINILNNIAIKYINLKDDALALGWCKRAIKYCTDKGQTISYAFGLVAYTASRCYFNKKDIQKAKEYASLANNLIEQHSSGQKDYANAGVYLMMADIYSYEKDYTKAESYYKKMLSFIDTVPIMSYRLRFYKGYSDFLTEIHKYKVANIYLTKYTELLIANHKDDLIVKTNYLLAKARREVRS